MESVEFGAHFASDGNTWLADDPGACGLAADIERDGVRMAIGDKYTEHSYTMSRDEALDLIALLREFVS